MVGRRRGGGRVDELPLCDTPGLAFDDVGARIGGWMSDSGVRRSVVLVTVAAFLVAGCGGDGSSVAAEGGPGETVAVRAADNRFIAEEVRVRAGTEIVWTNTGRNPHDVVPAEGNGWGVALDAFAPGSEYRRVFSEPGTYAYYCTIHGTAGAGMKGVVIVEE